MGDSGEGGSGMLEAGEVFDGHGEPWRERGRPGVERLPKSKREGVGTDSLAGRNAEGGNASTRCSVVLGNRPRVVEDDLVDEPDCKLLYGLTVSLICQEGRREGAEGFTEEPSVYDLTDFISSSGSSDPSSVKISLLLSDEL